MWKLKVAEGGSPWLRTLNNHVGRQVWEFDPHSGSPQDLHDVETARRNFHDNRFTHKHSDDLLMRLQFAKENPMNEVLPKVKVKDIKDVTEEAVTTTLRRALNFYSTIQSHDGHWPGDYGGPMFLMPGLEDLYYPHPLVQDILWATLHKFVEPIFMNWPGKKLREKAIKTVIEHIHNEDENTRYICIGPVNKAFKLHLPRINDYLWGYNGSQLWDTAFAAQAIISTSLIDEFGPTLKKAHAFIKNSQVPVSRGDDGRNISNAFSKGENNCCSQSTATILERETGPSSETLASLTDPWW
ncbi:hypothetical protein RYX36_012438 [Vicia faba]